MGERGYAELHCHTNFSFLDGASHPEELADEAVRLGLAALAVTDHDGLYGVVRFALAARRPSSPRCSERSSRWVGGRRGGRAVASGARGWRRSERPRAYRPAASDDRKADPPGEHLVVLAQGPAGYARLARAVSEVQLAGEKGAPRPSWARSRPPRARPSTSTATAAAPRTAPGSCSPAAARAQCRVRCSTTARPRPGAPSTGSPPRSGATACSSSCGTTATRSTATATTPSPRSRRAPGSTSSPPTTSTTPPRPAPARHRARGGAGPPLARRARRVAARRRRSRTCGHRGSRPVASRAGPARWSARSSSRRRARSTSASPRPSCPTTRCRPAHTEMTWLRELTARGAELRYPPSHEQHEQA